MQATTQNANEIVTESQPASQPSIMTDLLNGYRFRVCETAEDIERALEVRRAVYNGNCGYDVPVPDEHDSRSWILLAEDMQTGKAVGTMRVTPRFGGKLELVEPAAVADAAEVFLRLEASGWKGRTRRSPRPRLKACVPNLWPTRARASRIRMFVASVLPPQSRRPSSCLPTR